MKSVESPIKRMAVYKNIYCHDTAVIVLYWNSTTTGPTYKVKVKWWNVVSDDRSKWFDMGVSETLYIPKEKWNREWVRIDLISE